MPATKEYKELFGLVFLYGGFTVNFSLFMLYVFRGASDPANIMKYLIYVTSPLPIVLAVFCRIYLKNRGSSRGILSSRSSIV